MLSIAPLAQCCYLPVIQNAVKNHSKLTVVTLYLSFVISMLQVKYLVLFFYFMQKLIFLKLVSGYLIATLALNHFFVITWSLRGGDVLRGEAIICLSLFVILNKILGDTISLICQS